MNALLRRLFRRPAAPLPKSRQQLADETVTAADAGLADLFRELGPPPEDEPADTDDALRKARHDLTYELDMFVDDDAANDLFDAAARGPRPVGCVLCEPTTVWLDNRICDACRQRTPFQPTNQPGPQ